MLRTLRFPTLSALALISCSLIASGAVNAAERSEEEVEARAEKAQTVLNDTAFYDRWNAKGAIDSPDTAAKVKDAADKELSRVERAMKDVQAACTEKFFVNKCIDDARRLSFSREREIRRVIVAADEVIRAERVRKMEENRAKNAAAKREPPMKISPKEVKNDRPEPIRIAPKKPSEPSLPMKLDGADGRKASEPVDLKPKEVKAPSEPAGIQPKEVKDASLPALIPGSKVEVSPDAARKDLEDANEAWYAEKQAQAVERQREAEERAKKRRKDREAKQQQFEKSLEERSEAQKRYEDRQKEKSSGLAKYF